MVSLDFYPRRNYSNLIFNVIYFRYFIDFDLIILYRNIETIVYKIHKYAFSDI
jgi:hypothetical protein